MTAAEKKAYKAKQLRYKKPIVRGLNIDTSSSYPKELNRVENDLQRVLDDLRRIKELHTREEVGEIC